jgi:hypothetical protein
MATDAVPRHRVGAEGLPWLGARVPGALSLLAVGIVHLQQYFELYSEIPTIGTLFVFGFQEPGYDPSAIMASRIAEVATVVFLGAFLAGRLTRRR